MIVTIDQGSSATKVLAFEAEEVQPLVQRDEVFLPAIPADQSQSLLNQWRRHLEAEGVRTPF